MDKLYIVIPAYNEEDNIVSVINDWYPVVEKIGNGSRLLIIDDGSRVLLLNHERTGARRLSAYY